MVIAVSVVAMVSVARGSSTARSGEGNASDSRPALDELEGGVGDPWLAGLGPSGAGAINHVVQKLGDLGGVAVDIDMPIRRQSQTEAIKD